MTTMEYLCHKCVFMLTILEDTSSPPVFKEVRVAQSVVFCVVFCRSLQSFCPFFLYHCSVSPSS